VLRFVFSILFINHSDVVLDASYHMFWLLDLPNYFNKSLIYGLGLYPTSGSNLAKI